MQILAQKLKELRKEKKLNQTTVAKSLGLEYYTLGKWEQGRAEPSAEDLTKLADYFNVSVDYLLGREDDFGNIITQSPASTLTDEEKEVIDIFRSIPDNTKSVALTMLQALAPKKKEKSASNKRA